MATIYGKIDCISSQSFSNTLDANRLIQEVYCNFFDFMSYLQTQGVSELVTRYSGYEYWDISASNAGSNAFSVWKMKANVERNWDWYLYIHNGSMNSGSFTSPSNVLQTRILTGVQGSVPAISITESSAATFGVFVQSAFSLSGSLTTNPWNGTIDFTGNASKSNPVWATGSAGYSVHVLPRFNNLSGSRETQKDVATPICRYVSTTTANTQSKTRHHFLSDGHGILFLNEAVIATTITAALPVNYAYTTYIGPYKLLDGITQANIGKILGGSGSFGFCHISNTQASRTNGNITTGTPPTSIFTEATEFGNITSADGNFDGGIFVTSDFGVRKFAISADATTNVSPYQTNPFAGGKIDGRAYNLYCTEPGFEGATGVLDSDIFRVMGGSPVTHDMTSDGKYAIFGANNAASNKRLIVAWSGSAPGTNITRQGIKFTRTGFTF